MEQFPATNPNPMLSVGKNGMVLYSNEASEPLLREWGVTVGEKLPLSIVNIVQKVIAQNYPEKTEVKVGKEICLVVFHPFPEQECVNIYGFNINDQKEREEEFLERGEKYHGLYDLMEEAIQICELRFDEKGQPIDNIILDVNPAYEKHSGLRREQVIGCHIKDILPIVEQIWLDRYGEVVLKGKRIHFEEYNASLDKWFEVFTSPMEGNRFFSVFSDITERKQMEIELHNSEERLRFASKAAGFGVYDSNLVDGTIYWSPEMKTILGLPADAEPILNIVPNFVHPDDVESVQQMYHEAFDHDGSGIFLNEHRIIRPDGTIRWVQFIGQSRFEGEGVHRHAVRVSGVMMDVTERKVVEEALKKAHETLEEKVKERTSELEIAYNLLKESERSLAEAQKLAHIGNWDRDLITNEIYWSDEAYHIFGFEPQEFGITYSSFLSRVHPDDQDCVIEGTKQILEKKFSNIDYRIVLNNGEERIVHEEVKVFFDEKSNPVQFRGTVQDITEQKKLEENLRENEEKYRNIVETANEGISIIDAEAKINYANNKIGEIFGYSPKELIGRLVWDFVSEDFKDITRLNIEKRQRGVNENLETKLIRRDGSSIWVSINTKSIFDRNGAFIGSMNMLTDITKRKEAEESLDNIDIVRKKEIHHRIKNNLQVISSLLDLQAEQFRNRANIMDSEVLEAFRESQNRVISMALIHEELYRGEELDKLNFSLYIEELAKTLFQTYRLGNTDISLNMNLEENFFFDMDIAVPLGIIINELVSNSLKHAFPDRKKGEIRIKLHREESTELEIEGCQSTSFILTVSDNGVGIPENLDIEDLDTLGMQLVTSLVDQLDGELELRRGNGTEFTIRFS